ncbi:MAG: pilus assembly protein PilM [Candidatus Omnitrophota bacterium]
MFGRKRFYLIIESSANFIKIVVLGVLTRIKIIEKVIVENITNLSDSDIIAVLERLLKELRLKNPLLVIVIPRSMVTMRNLKFPSADLKEIVSMVELYAPRQVPFGKEEIIYDFHVIGKDEAGYAIILLAIIHRDVVRRQLNMFAKCGLSTEDALLSSNGLLDVNSLISTPKGQETHVLLDIDTAEADFVVISKDNLLFTRSIALGINRDDWQKEEERFLQDVKQTLVIYQNEDIGKKPSRIFVCGLFKKFPDLKQKLFNTVNIPVEIIERFEGIPIRNSAREELERYAKKTSFYDLLGLAAAVDKKKINLIPREIKIKKELKDKFSNLLFIGVMLAAIFILLSCLLVLKLHARQVYFEMLDEKINNIEKEAAILINKQGLIGEIKQQLNERGSFIEAFAEISRAVPWPITITAISFEKNDKLILKGQAEAMSDVFNLVMKLEEAAMFTNVKTKYTTKRRIKDKELTDFEILCPLEKERR